MTPRGSCFITRMEVLFGAGGAVVRYSGDWPGRR